jgi:hypothetical protein
MRAMRLYKADAGCRRVAHPADHLRLLILRGATPPLGFHLRQTRCQKTINPTAIKVYSRCALKSHRTMALHSVKPSKGLEADYAGKDKGEYQGGRFSSLLQLAHACRRG